MIYGAMLAGGVGRRVKSSKIPKQFIEINGLPIIFYTLKNMLKVKSFDYIYIAVHKDYVDYLQNIINKNLIKEDSAKVRLILGGKERIDTIHNVTDAIVNDNGLNENDIIVIHDSVRPFVTEKILNDSIECAAKHGAVVTALPASDTIIHSVDKKIVSEIPDRSIVFHGQAPDSFNLKKLIDMENNLTVEQKKIIVGTSQICTFNNVDMYLIEGDAINFKITTDSDLDIVRNILSKEK
ncbi:IspD/TarI family cytidylyltransferase [Anaerofustis stercorihominis]|uniref:IspD/TarI family cytidylyltransferase n=1 Tax=Anaerofustis stercorihominis TaxID=214853 RepID=UPI00214CB267|nr:IspD/TarI family cytidylyltransferase [Anaerofustis stercorihominis]MCR2033209.1 2-C-methyl-D-erythritol 4-phosphate cytidylyltransferase [Anaerofustis stercorihominis]